MLRFESVLLNKDSTVPAFLHSLHIWILKGSSLTTRNRMQSGMDSLDGDCNCENSHLTAS